MTLDEPNENDEVFEIDGFTYLVDRHLLAESRPITVDFLKYGFRITGRTTVGGNQCAC